MKKVNEIKNKISSWSKLELIDKQSIIDETNRFMVLSEEQWEDWGIQDLETIQECRKIVKKIIENW